MKAKEYFKNYQDLRKDNGWELALVRQLEAMFQEVKEIIVKRKAKKDSAIISILEEMNTKSKALVRMINNAECRELKQDAFKIFIQNQMPDFAKIIGWE